MTTPSAAEPEPSVTPEVRRAKVWHFLGPVLVVILLITAAIVLHRELGGVRFRAVVRAAHAIPSGQLALGAGLTALAYLVLVGYDALALWYAGHPLSLRKAGFASFIAYGLSQTLGFPLFTGGSIRLRLWSGWGLSAEEIAQAIAFVSLMFTTGLLLVGGAVLVLEPRATAQLLRLPIGDLRPLGIACLLATAGYLVWSARSSGRPIRIRDWVFPVPPLRIAVLHLLIAFLDWVVAAAVLYVLLPAHPGVSFPAFVGAFLLAQIAGLVSHIPGGVGVFESVMVITLAGRLGPTTVLGTILAYRLIYYLLPFGAAVVLLGGREALAHRRRIKAASQAVGAFAGRWLPPLIPQFLAVTTFLAGAILLVSGATPGVHGRLRWLGRVLPLGIIEASHFVTSLAGVGLIVLARGLSRRLDAAWLLTVGLLAVGAVGSLLKGLDWEEAVVLLTVLAAVLPSRRAFHRKAALLAEPWSRGWIVAVVSAVGASIWLGLLSYRHLEYRDELWWRFVLRGDASRFLRATAGAVVVLAVLGLLRLLRHAPARPPIPARNDLAHAKEIVANSPDTVANLALLGDKSLLFSGDRQAFLMYGVKGRSWIALGDPVGPRAAQVELVWRFREEADRHGGWPVFYQVGPEHLPLYIELGLSLLKLGEEASVSLSDFSLDGPSRRALRRTVNQMERDRVHFEVVPVEEVPALLPDLKIVSDRWLADKATREKGFSLGRFDPEYLSHFPVALARSDHRILGFANLWLGAGRSELAIDLMRYPPDAPGGVMQFLFTELMLWGRDQGFQRFRLGMAPMSGLENRPLAPLWNRVGSLLYRHGEHFYHFRGLRSYKEKFDPAWEPRYLASPGGLRLARILTNVAALISGGLRGVLAR